MNEEIKENPQKSGGIVERNSDGTFKKGHIKLGGAEKGKSYSFTAILKKKLAKIIKEKGIEAGEELVDIWLELAKKDFNALKEVVRYIDGMPKQMLSLGVDESVEKVEIEITTKKDDSKNPSDKGVPTELGAISEEGEEAGHQRGGNGFQQDIQLGAVDGNDNAQGTEQTDNDNEKDTASA